MIAVTRDVSPAVARCELTHLARTPIDYGRAVAQHAAYRALLASLGCEMVEIAGDAAYPDCVFIEDTAVVLEDLAVITRPGAESRRGEVDAVAAVLARSRPIVRIEAPGTIDGGDVLVLDDRIFVGRTSRTNDEGIAQLRALTGREVIPIEVRGALHLKTAITRVAPDALLVNRAWIDAAPFAGWRMIDVDPSEPFAANALMVGDAVVYPAAFPRTRARLAGLDVRTVGLDVRTVGLDVRTVGLDVRTVGLDVRTVGLDVRTVDADELAKAEGGVTCCSILIGEI